jgi:nitrite reductase/ring-hydroxylating ferredoxin subunit
VAVRSPAGLTAFVNVCAHRHQPVVVDDKPLDDSGRLECRAHGAFYDPATGLCVEGPCEGARLVSVPVRDDGAQLFVEDDDTVDDSVYGTDEEAQ